MVVEALVWNADIPQIVRSACILMAFRNVCLEVSGPHIIGCNCCKGLNLVSLTGDVFDGCGCGDSKSIFHQDTKAKCGVIISFFFCAL